MSEYPIYSVLAQVQDYPISRLIELNEAIKKMITSKMNHYCENK